MPQRLFCGLVNIKANQYTRRLRKVYAIILGMGSLDLTLFALSRITNTAILYKLKKAAGVNNDPTT